MKTTRLPLALTLFLFSTFALNAQGTSSRWFVKDDAIGANNGQKWKDAFNSLQDALAAAEEGDEIWVAEGTYLPGGAPSSTFLIDKNLQLYGGFAGTETTLAERSDPTGHLTILSGDLNGDDVEDDFTTNRGDNVMTVLTVSPDITNETVIDGFLIKGGQADEAGGGALTPSQSGGGMYGLGSPLVRHCIFTQNYALFLGGGAYLNPAENPVFENCRFVSNKCNYRGAGLSFQSPAGGSPEVSACHFENNDAKRGGGISFIQTNAKATGCNFISNTTTEQGGALFHWTPEVSGLTVEVEGCHFEGNVSTIGGAFFMESYSGLTDMDYRITDCSFVENFSAAIAPGWGQSGGGGGITLGASNAAALIEGCTFSQNSTTGFGGGLSTLLTGQDVQLDIRNCEFYGNTAGSESGGLDLWGSSGGQGMFRVESCLFENNIAGSGGGISMGAGWQGAPGMFEFLFSSNICRSNQAEKGGGMFLYSNIGSQADFVIGNCQFYGNTATVEGGATFITDEDPNFNVTIGHSIFTNNQNPGGGGCIATELSFEENVSMAIENSLIANNTGGHSVLSVSSTPIFRLLNCTVADNLSTALAVEDDSGLAMQNSILANPGQEEYSSAWVGNVISLGGNLVLDGSMNAYLTARDKPETAPSFIPGTFEPSPPSPLINAGVNEGVTALHDLAGNERIQHGTIDIGAYESSLVSGAKEALAGPVELFPNPAGAFLHIQLPGNAARPFEATIYDAKGRLVQESLITPGQAVRVEGLAAGLYLVKAMAGGKIYTGEFSKL